MTNVFILPSKQFQNRRMKAKKDHSAAALSPDLLYTDDSQIIQNYPTYQQPSMPLEYASNNNSDLMIQPNPASGYNDLMNINHEQQQTHLELSSSFV